MNKYLYGLDISLKETGIAIYDLDESKFVFIDSFNTEKIKATYEYKGLEVNAIKLHKIGEWFADIVAKYPPKEASIERMFSRFPAETQVIAKATGVIQHIIWDIPQSLYPPKVVKLAVIKGDASKAEVANQILVNIPDLEMKNYDESDAVAVALCHLIKTGVIEWEKPPVVEKPKKKRTPKKKVGTEIVKEEE